MTSLIEKFKNVRFPNWMRQIKTDYPMSEVKAANDNVNSSVAAADADRSSVIDEMHRAYLEYLLFGRTVLNFPKTPKNVGIMANAAKDMFPADLSNSLKFKLKIPVSVKRRLRRDKKNYQKVRKWLDEMEQSVNQALFGGNVDER